MTDTEAQEFFKEESRRLAKEKFDNAITYIGDGIKEHPMRTTGIGLGILTLMGIGTMLQTADANCIQTSAQSLEVVTTPIEALNWRVAFDYIDAQSCEIAKRIAVADLFKISTIPGLLAGLYGAFKLSQSQLAQELSKGWENFQKEYTAISRYLNPAILAIAGIIAWRAWPLITKIPEVPNEVAKLLVP